MIKPLRLSNTTIFAGIINLAGTNTVATVALSLFFFAILDVPIYGQILPLRLQAAMGLPEEIAQMIITQTGF